MLNTFRIGKFLEKMPGVRQQFSENFYPRTKILEKFLSRKIYSRSKILLGRTKFTENFYPRRFFGRKKIPVTVPSRKTHGCFLCAS